MFRKMRRHRQALTFEQCEKIFQEGTSGVLAVNGDSGYPYAVPLSYVYSSGKIYFHCAKSGHKLEAVKADPRVSFCVIAKDEIVPEEYTTYFRSVIAFGKIRILEEPQAMRAAAEMLARKYASEAGAKHRQAAIDREFAALCIMEMEIKHMSGKEAIELVRKSDGKQ